MVLNLFRKDDKIKELEERVSELEAVNQRQRQRIQELEESFYSPEAVSQRQFQEFLEWKVYFLILVAIGITIAIFVKAIKVMEVDFHKLDWRIT